MAKEIERKFVAKQDGAWRQGRAIELKQGYLAAEEAATVRVRLAGDKAFLTVKGKTENATRDEFEYPIPHADAEAMLADLCRGRIVEKTRYVVDHEGWLWEVDEFHGRHQGLVVAELELDRPDREFPLPDWIEHEVTGDPRYYNANLAREAATDGDDG